MLIRVPVLRGDQAQERHQADRIQELLLPTKGGHHLRGQPGVRHLPSQWTHRQILTAIHQTGLDEEPMESPVSLSTLWSLPLNSRLFITSREALFLKYYGM